MANKRDSQSEHYNSADDNEYDSENEVPGVVRFKKRDVSGGLLGSDLADNNPLFDGKRVHFSSNRRK